MTSHIGREKKWLTKICNLCWKGIGRTSTFGVILKTNEKLIKNWNELLLVGSSETNNKVPAGNMATLTNFLKFLKNYLKVSDQTVHGSRVSCYTSYIKR